MDRLRFCINDQWHEVADGSPTTTLLRYLRDQARLTGTKEGCAEGDCGACTVAVLEEGPGQRPTFRGVNACLVLLPMVQGKRVYTAEGLKDGEQHHPAQKELAERLGSQCGYCTPGIVMSLFEATYRDDLKEPWQLDAQLCGNLCRCTGYRPIREAARALAGRCPEDRFRAQLVSGDREPMELSFQGAGQRFETPGSLSALWDVLEAQPDARLVAGGTDLCLEVTKRFARPSALVSLEALLELKGLSATPQAITLGASAPLSDVESFCGRELPPVARMLRYFGSRQIKNRATLGGNLCTASPIGDLAPVLLALEATVVCASRAGERRIPMDQFFLGYRKTALRAGEILARVEIPRPQPGSRIGAYKVSKRRELDISTVSACLRVDVDDAGRVTRARLAYGGMAATPVRARRAEATLEGAPWTQETSLAAAAAVEKELTPLSDHRGSATYRRLVARNLLRGFFHETLAAPVLSLPELHTATVLAR